MLLSPCATSEGAARAGRLLELSERLAESGRRGEALDAAREACQALRDLARLSPDVYLPDLAEGLSVMADRLREARRMREGVAVSQETVRLRRRLTRHDYDAHASGLAQALCRLAVDLSAYRELRDALASAQESGRCFGTSTMLSWLL